MAKSKLETIFDYPLDDGKIGKLQIDAEAHLYWNGKPIATGITLTTQQGYGAWVVVIAAGLGGVLALLEIIWWFKAW